MIHNYEITYLVDPQAEEDTQGELHAQVDSLIADLGGTVVEIMPNMRKKLKYPIHKKFSVFSRVIQVTLEPEKIEKVQQFLKKSKGIERFIILNTPKRTRIRLELLEEKKELETKGARAKEPMPKKEVTMEEVEKGIEEALSEEVK